MPEQNNYSLEYPWAPPNPAEAYSLINQWQPPTPGTGYYEQLTLSSPNTTSLNVLTSPSRLSSLRFTASKKIAAVVLSLSLLSGGFGQTQERFDINSLESNYWVDEETGYLMNRDGTIAEVAANLELYCELNNIDMDSLSEDQMMAIIDDLNPDDGETSPTLVMMEPINGDSEQTSVDSLQIFPETETIPQPKPPTYQEVELNAENEEEQSSPEGDLTIRRSRSYMATNDLNSIWHMTQLFLSENAVQDINTIKINAITQSIVQQRIAEGKSPQLEVGERIEFSASLLDD